MLDEHMGPIKKYSILTVGAVVLALANYVFKFPNHFSFGGVAGFAVILSGMFGGSASTYTFVINMLLLLIAFPILGKEVAMRSFYVSIVFSGVLEVAQYVYPIDKPITNQPVLELVFSFMLLAVCSAIFFFMDASSGGTDIIALILKKVYQRVNRNGVTACRLRSCFDFFLCIQSDRWTVFICRIPCKIIFH